MLPVYGRRVPGSPITGRSAQRQRSGRKPNGLIWRGFGGRQITGLRQDRRRIASIAARARAIGAFAVADAATRLEAVMGSGSDPSDSLAELGDAVSLARASIEALLRRS